MPSARFVVGRIPAPGESVDLPPEEAAHARARRVADGAPVVVIDGTGREGLGEIDLPARGAARVRVSAVRGDEAAPRGPRLWLGVAAVRNERLAWIAEKAGELGVERLVVVRTERTQAFRGGEVILARLDRIVREAAKQSGATRWPVCEGPLPLGDALASAPFPNRCLIDSSGEPFPSALAGGSASLLVGPEGGWSDGEVEAARGERWSVAALPAGKLRTETAAIAAVVLARAATGRAAPGSL